MQNPGPTDSAPTSGERPQKSRDPLHGITLEAIVTRLSEHYGWDELARRIPIRCFQYDPSIKSSLTFLRKTPWARQKVEELFVTWSRRSR